MVEYAPAKAIMKISELSDAQKLHYFEVRLSPAPLRKERARIHGAVLFSRGAESVALDQY